MPKQPDFDSLQMQIGQLAKILSTKDQILPTFIPHVTVVGGIECPSLEVAERFASELAKGFRGHGGLKCSFETPTTQWLNDDKTPKWNTACVAPMEQSDRFDQIVTRVHIAMQSVGLQFRSITPPAHFSFVYADMLLDQSTFPPPPPTFECNVGALYCTSPSRLDGVQHWYEISRFSLL